MKAITISLSPNTEPDDVWLAFRSLCTPWMWFSKSVNPDLLTSFQTLFQTEKVYFYNSGRSALYELIKAFGIGNGDEVIVQAFTCVAVPNSILWNGATPVYADIDDSYNLTVKTIQKVYSNKTKAIIVQHTFGIPAEIDEIVAFAKQHNLIVIEDCAHALGATYKGKLLGTWGNAAFFSFGRDKVISSVFGGAAIVRSQLPIHNSLLVHQELQGRLEKMKRPSYWWVFQQLFHPVAFVVILRLYAVGIGKLLLVLLQKLRLLSFPVYQQEKQCMRPAIFPGQYPYVLTRLAGKQVQKLKKFNNQRKAVAAMYRRELGLIGGVLLPPDRSGSIYLRFPIQVSDPDRVMHHAKAHGVLLGNWYRTVIDPQGVDIGCAGYRHKTCPQAEATAAHIVNLPTRISLSDAQTVVDVIKNVIV